MPKGFQGFQKGHTPRNKGNKWPDYVKDKMKEACKKRDNSFAIKNLEKAKGKQPKGEDHWNWKGGITDERVKLWNSGEYAKWRKIVYERDNYT